MENEVIFTGGWIWMVEEEISLAQVFQEGGSGSGSAREDVLPSWGPWTCVPQPLPPAWASKEAPICQKSDAGVNMSHHVGHLRDRQLSWGNQTVPPSAVRGSVVPPRTKSARNELFWCFCPKTSLEIPVLILSPAFPGENTPLPWHTVVH